MRVAGALLRRSLVHAGQLLAAVGIVAVGVAALVALLAVPASGIDRGVATLLADAEPTAGALRVETALADDAAAQDDRVGEALATGIGDAPVDVIRAVRSAPVAVDVGGTSRQLVLATQDRLDRLAELVDGAWAAADDEVTLAEPAAAALGVGVGDVLELPRGPHRVVGVWRALDTSDAAWFSEALVASGRFGDAVGPVIVADTDLAELDVRPRVSWTLVPHDVDAATLTVLRPVEGRVRAATSGLASGTSYAVSVSGELGATLARAESAVAAARVLAGTAIVLALVTAGIVLALVGRSLAQVHASESALLAARGLSPAGAAALAAGEASVVVVLGAALGTGLAVWAASAADAAVPPVAFLAAVAAALAAAVLLTAAARPAPLERDGRGTPAETDQVVPALGAAALAGFALVTANAVPASPVSFVAPALALVAGVLLLRLLLAPGMRLAERVAARGTGLLPVLPLRQLGRRPRAVASGFVVVALAAGAVAVASLAADGIARQDAAEVASAVGGEVRIRFAGVDRDPVQTTPYAALDGVTAATGVALVTPEAGSVSTSLVVAGDGFAEVTGTAPPADADGALPAQLTPALASRLGVAVGDEVPLRIPGVREAVPGVVARIAPVPGVGGSGLLVAREALAARLPADATALAVDEVWLATGAPDATAALVRAASSRAVTVLTPRGAGTGAVEGVGATATAASAGLVVLMGIGGLAAAAAGLRRVRRGEVLPLRALGVGAAAQARGRFVELLLTALAGIVAGLAAGVLAAWFATGAAPSAGAVGSPATGVLGAVLLVGVLVVAAAAARAVRRDAGVRS